MAYSTGHRPGHRQQAAHTVQRTQYGAGLEALRYKAFTQHKSSEARPLRVATSQQRGKAAGPPGRQAFQKEAAPGREALKVLPGLKKLCGARKARYFTP